VKSILEEVGYPSIGARGVFDEDAEIMLHIWDKWVDSCVNRLDPEADRRLDTAWTNWQESLNY
jgi:hypothetical protein